MTQALLSRRIFLAGLASAVLPARAVSAGSDNLLSKVDFRGSLDASQFGIEPGDMTSKAKAFTKLLKEASARNMPVFLPPGTYQLGNIELPENIRIEGVPGATRLVYSGDGSFIRSLGGKRVALSNLIIDGGNRWLAENQPGLLTFQDTKRLSIDNCEILGSSRFGIWAERCDGRIRDNVISGALDSGVYAVECNNFEIRDNKVSDCGNGGILVHRWKKGFDGGVVSGNRISRIFANAGGTGENGNGINVYRADDVKISDNFISDCAFTAVRSNAGSNVQITDNHCLNSGEMAIYSEFGFEGAIISGNLVDGCANGISSTNFNEGGRLAIISSNIVRNLHLTAPYTEEGQYFGIGISAEADAVISGNLIENAPLWALQIGWGPFMRNVSVTGNVIRKAPVGCAVSVVEDAGKVTIRDNMFSEIGEASIAGYRWAEKVTGDLAKEGAEAFPHLDLDGNQTA